jgi:acetyltransferase-like isoleucine patch superfamily enzyme
VTGFDQLQLSTPNYTGGNINQIAYDDYLNVSSASVFISQLTGGSSAKIHFSFYEAGGGGSDLAPGDLLPEEGLNDVSSQSYSYIGDHVTDSHLTDDTDVAIASVTIGAFTWNYNDASNDTTQGGIRVTITGNDVIVNGAKANDLITFTAVDDAGSSVDGTFNRIDIQAMSGSASFDIGHIDLTSGGLTTADLGNHLFVDDDGPAIDPSNDATQPNDLQVANATDATGTDSSFYLLTPGTDGQQSLTIINPDTGDYTEDSQGDFQWTYDNGDHTSITGTYKGTDLYTLVLNSDGTYTFTMTDTLPGTDVGLSSTVIHAGGPTDTVDVLAKAPSTDFARIVGDDGTNNPLVNASHGYVGVDNGNLDNGESLTLSLYDASSNPIDFSELKIGTKSAGMCHYDIFVTMSDSSYIQVGDNVAIGKNGTIDVLDPNSSDNVLIESVTIFKVDGNAIKIGLSNIHFITPPDDALLEFGVQLLDGDNDAVTSSFTVGIDGNNDGSFDATVNSAAILPTGPVSSLTILGSVDTSDSLTTMSQAHHDYLIA